MTDAQVAYDNWKAQHKASLMVYTDYQMFEIGFNIAQDIIQELSAIILAMEKDAKKMNTEIQKLKKASKAP
jgi:hypothetical protein